MVALLRRLGRGAVLAGIFLVACVAGLIAFTGAEVGGHTTAASTGAPPPPSPARTPLQAFSEQAGARESGGDGVPGAPVLSERPPVPPRRFRAPIARFRRYSEGQVARLIPAADRLVAAVRSGPRARARAAWRTAFARYERLGAVYGALGSLDVAIAGRTGDLHRLERGLWGDTRLARLVPDARRLAADARDLRRRVPREHVTPLAIATRAHEILEDAQRDFMSGQDVPASREGVLATDANLRATAALLAALHPLLKGTDAIDPSLLALHRLRAALDRVRRAHGGRLPTLDGLRRPEREALDGALSFALERLQAIPGTLETADPVPVPSLPAR